ncbi:MAG: hypothetical protein V2I76_08915, partial [Roseobacter sp.]|nr:hypothetical protein [Roseobacter sp.]
CFFHTAQTHQAALELAQERFDEAEAKLSALSERIAKLPQQTVVLSHEDFSGALPGRSYRRGVYSKLTKNLRVLTRALRPHAVHFVFFQRPETEWLRSCYHQHLKFRTRFHSFEDFSNHFGQDFSWVQRLQKPRDVFGANFSVVAYDSAPDAGIRALFDLLPLDSDFKNSFPGVQFANKSPDVGQIALLERVNEMSEFSASAWFSKSLLLKKRPTAPVPDAKACRWPPDVKKPDVCALPALYDRTRSRVPSQNVEDIMPPPTVDLETLARERLPVDVEMPDLERADIRNQSTILDYHLRGKSRLSHLNALTISYLRRDTAHTEKARKLFHRIWREQGPALVNELSTRWLISTLQTFLDHGINEAQRSIGTVGYFYGNMMKIYEGERAIEGHDQDTSYPNLTPQTQNHFRGMDRYTVGGSDLMLNTNALALEIALRDDVAGPVLQEFLLRVKNAETVFSRHDKTRHENGVSVPGFEDVWTFFEPWEP